MTVTAAMVKSLRERSGAGMMDAKKALVECNGNEDEAMDLLRTKGIAKAEKKSGRIAAEGTVFILAEGNKGAMIEVNSETDFVAKNENFLEFVKTLTTIVLTTGTTDVEALKTAEYGAGKTVAEKLTDLVAKIGENISIRRAELITASNGVVNGYTHMGGKIGVLVAIENATTDKASEVARNLSMHVAASNPQYLDRTQVDQVMLAKERAVFTEQAEASGKPANIVEKIVEGRISKFCEEICLVDQAFVMDTDRKVGQVVTELGAEAKIASYTRFGLGEGIEKKEDDFAAEVAAAVAS
jgi:elongation factor Ts